MKVSNQSPLGFLLFFVLWSCSLSAQTKKIKGNFTLDHQGTRYVLLDVRRLHPQSNQVTVSSAQDSFKLTFTDPLKALRFELFVLRYPGKVELIQNRKIFTIQREGDLAAYNSREFLQQLKTKDEKEGSRVVPNLEVNLDHTVRTVSRMTEIQGIRQLILLASIEKKKEAWVYIPSNKLWIEIGKKEISKPNENSSLLLDLVFLAKLVKKYGEITIFTLHPHLGKSNQNNADKMLDRFHSLKKKQNRYVALKLTQGYNLVHNAIPSQDDYLTQHRFELLLRALYKTEFDKQFKVNWKIAYNLGVTEFRAPTVGYASPGESLKTVKRNYQYFDDSLQGIMLSYTQVWVGNILNMDKESITSDELRKKILFPYTEATREVLKEQNHRGFETSTSHLIGPKK